MPQAPPHATRVRSSWRWSSATGRRPPSKSRASRWLRRGTSEFARALKLGGAAAAEFDRLGIDLSGIRFWNALLDRYFTLARGALGPAAADAARETGRNMDFDAAIREALAG